MPSERRYSRKGGESEMTRAFGVIERYLQNVNGEISGEFKQPTLGTRSEMSSELYVTWRKVEMVIG